MPVTTRSQSAKSAQQQSLSSSSSLSPSTTSTRQKTDRSATPATPATLDIPARSATQTTKKKSKLIDKKHPLYADLKDHEVTEEMCKNIIDELKKIQGSSSKTKKQTAKIRNPFKPATEVNANGQVVANILAACHKKNIMQNEVLEFIDFEDLPDISSSRMSTIIEDDTFEEYKTSCKAIGGQKLIQFAQYKNHMQKLINVLLKMFEKYKQNTLAFNMFDDNTLAGYKSKIKEFDIDKQITIPRHDIFTHVEGVYSNNHVVFNTIMNKVVHMLFKRELNKVSLTYNHNRHIPPYDIKEYKRYSSILPKYICLDSSSISDQSLSRKFLADLKRLNELSAGFIADYEIVIDNKPEYIGHLATISDYADAREKNSILYTLINNNYNEKSTAEDYYYYFHYDGPAPAMSILNAYEYTDKLVLYSYQPLEIGVHQTTSIEDSYKGAAPFFSRPVNEGIRNYLLDPNKVDTYVYARIKNMLQYMSFPMKTSYDKKDIYVFHGTQKMMHEEGDKVLYLLSFLSCTFNIYISNDYATNNLSVFSRHIRQGYIYLFKINNATNYINFGDNLYQIILLPGTKITIHHTLKINEITYFLCSVDHDATEKNSKKLIESLDKLHKLYTLTTYTILNIKYLPDDGDKDPNMYPECLEIPSIAMSRINFKSNVENIFKVDRYIYCSLGKLLNDSAINIFFNIQYTIHQHIISECYAFFKTNCAKYVILYAPAPAISSNKTHIYTAWLHDADYDTAKLPFAYDINNLFVDTLLGNTDHFNIKNHIQHKSSGAFMRVFFKGCGMFNANGSRKDAFDEICTEHTTIAKSSSALRTEKVQELADNFTKNQVAFINFLNDLERRYINFMQKRLLIPHTSNEHNDIMSMIRNLIETLRKRSAYLRTNMIDVCKEIMDTVAVQGGDTALHIHGRQPIFHTRQLYQLKQSKRSKQSKQPKQSKQSKQPIISRSNKFNVSMRQRNTVDVIRRRHTVNSKRRHTVNVIQNKSMKKVYKNYGNIYHIDALRAPYKKYYKIPRQAQDYNDLIKLIPKEELNDEMYNDIMEGKYVDTLNDGYCISKKDFEKMSGGSRSKSRLISSAKKR